MIIATELKNKVGIYCILNIVNNKKYIGSSKSIWNRLQKHFSLLRNNKHENIILQNSFNKNSEEAYIVFCLRECEEKDLLHLEQYYIDLLKPQYNITKEVIRNTLSKESCEKISATLKKRYSEGMKPTKRTPIDVYTTEGVFVGNYFTMKDCSKELGVNVTSIIRVLQGAMQQCKGYVFYKEGCKEIRTVKINPNTGKPFRKPAPVKSI